jgi:type IV pilus assembly protein PilN
MIRVNLIAVERERGRKRVIITAAHKVTAAALLVLLGTVAVVGWWGWSLRQQSVALDEELARAEVETRNVRSVLEQMRRFESQKALLQQRVTLIEQLRKGQSAPVHLLDEIGRSLPERLWLRELSQNGADFTMSGLTDSLTAVSDFVANLEDTRWFLRPVEIVDSQVQHDAQAGDLIRFQIKAQFVDPTAAPAPPVTAPGAGG